MPEMTVYQAVAQVMRDVQQVRKGETNQHFGFNFRGIDAVMNAVGPALREHGVLIVPCDMQAEYHETPTRNGTSMGVRVRNTYRFYGPAGDYFDTVATGESLDTGDKGTAKANSVALRTCLLQALCLPTDEPDPDSFSPERAARVREDKQRQAEERRKHQIEAFAEQLEQTEKAGDLAAVERVMEWARSKSLQPEYGMARGVLERMQAAAGEEALEGELVHS